MSVLSYAFGSAVIFNNEESSKLSRRKIGGQRNFGFNFNIGDTANYDIIRELKNYGQGYQEAAAKFLGDIPNSQYLNTRMLVAAYHWYFGNESPEVFTPDMFTIENPSFNLIREKWEKSYKDREWKQEHSMTLITYAMLIRNNQKYARVSDRPRVEVDRNDSESGSEYYEMSDAGGESEYGSDFD